MNITEVILFGGLALFVIATQLGRRSLSLRRFLLPLVAVVAVAFSYLKGIPTAGGDLSFEIICTLIGVAFGLLATSLVRVERDGQTGRLMTQAGIAYAAVWLVAFGGRLAFGWAASSVWQRQVGQFSFDHQITGADAWTAAFVLMAIAMVATRTVGLAARALWVSQSDQTRQALAA
ncbi:MAG TPA: hypothetical protein VN837_12060 [Chloroflexota bacterium]|nr:hypothetical protein [Chloroflexota bacterium]